MVVWRRLGGGGGGSRWRSMAEGMVEFGDLGFVEILDLEIKKEIKI